MASKQNKLLKVVYSSEEEAWLVSHALAYKQILENKKTDGATKRDKDKAWEQIANKFNTAPPGQERRVKSLREKYQKIKQTLKNRVFYVSNDAKKTGGGPPKKELPALSETMQELFKILIPATYGLAAATGDSESNPMPEPELEKVNILEPVVLKDVQLDLATNDLRDDEKLELVSPEMNRKEHTWERVNIEKLRKPTNPLLSNRRRKAKDDETEVPRKMLKISEEMKNQWAEKHAIEMEILECERERYKLERERAVIERERAEFDRERSLVELQRAKNQLEFDIKIHNIRLAAMEGN